MHSNNNFSKTPIQRAIQYTLVISFLYAIFKFFDIDSPTGNEFISYIIPKVLIDVVLIIFPLLLAFFYLTTSNIIDEVKNNMLNNKNSCNSSDADTLLVLREYHAMLKEGIITQEEFDTIKRKQLRELNKKT